jgi:hypothetical protein
MKRTNEIIDILKREQSNSNNELWKYYIDSNDWQHRKNIYDTGNRDGVSEEPGYLVKSTLAFNQFVLDPSVAEQPLTIDRLDQIHAAHLTETLKKKGKKRIIQKRETDKTEVMNKRPVYVPLANDRHTDLNFSLPNLIDIATIYIRANSKNMQTHGLSIINKYSDMKSLYFSSLGVQVDLSQDILNTYEKSIKRANSLPEKTQAISQLIKSLEVLHPWGDGNARTLCMTLLYKECLRNGLFPPFQKNPNMFDSISAEGLSKHLLEQSDSTEQHFNNKHSHSKTNKEKLPTYIIPEEKPREELEFKKPLQKKYKDKLNQGIQNITFNDFKRLQKHGVFRISEKQDYIRASISHIDLKHLNKNLNAIIRLMTDEINDNIYNALDLQNKDAVETISTLFKICAWRENFPELKQHKLYNQDSTTLWRKLCTINFHQNNPLKLYIQTKQYSTDIERNQRSESLKIINDIFLKHVFIKTKKHYISYAKKNGLQDKYEFREIINQLSSGDTLEDNSVFITTALSQRTSANNSFDAEIICHLIRATKEFYDNTFDFYDTPQKNYQLQQNSPLLENLIAKKIHEILLEISLSDFLSPDANKEIAAMILETLNTIPFDKKGDILDQDNKNKLCQALEQSPKLLQTYLAILHYIKQQPKSFMSFTLSRTYNLLRKLTRAIMTCQLTSTSYKKHMKIWCRKFWQPNVFIDRQNIQRDPKHDNSRIFWFELLDVDNTRSSDIQLNESSKNDRLKP